MLFTIDSRRLCDALKRLKIRRSMFAYIHIRVQDGLVHLRSLTHPMCTVESRMQVDLQVEPLAVEKEGTCAACFSELLQVAATLSGVLTVERQEHALMVSDALSNQIPVRWLHGEFPMTFEEHAENEIYTRTRNDRVQCDSCKEWHATTVVDTYQITRVLQQQLRIDRDLIAAMCAQVAWVVKRGEPCNQAQYGILFTLEQNVLTLVALDQYCFLIRKHTLPGSGNWSSPILIPAVNLTQALRLLPKGEEVVIETTSTQHHLIKCGDEDVSDATSFVQQQTVSLATPTMRVTLSPITRSFPNYQEKMPLSSPIRVRCSTLELARAVDAVIPPYDGDIRSHIQVNWNSSTLRLEAHREQLDESAHYEIPAQDSEGTGETIHLLSTYVRSLLKVTTASEMTLAFTGPHEPALFSSGGEDEAYLMVLACGWR